MIDFLKYRKACALFSLLIFGTFAGAILYKRHTRGQAFIYSVDFTGGVQVDLRPSKPIGSDTLKKVLDENGFENAVVREDSLSHDIFVRVKYEADAHQIGERMRTAIEQGVPDTKVEVLAIESVSGGVGETLRWNSMRAVVIALIVMLLYIAWRFWSFSFAAGAVFALFHDAVVILTCFLLLDKEISINVLGAILLILGYSINDTIVIFSKIKSNIALLRNTMSMDQIVNLSLNQTLRRTLLTSISTALVVLSLIVFGGESLRDLSLALLIGIIFGTYSSIYIASPVMLLLYDKKRTVA